VAAPNRISDRPAIRAAISGNAMARRLAESYWWDKTEHLHDAITAYDFQMMKPLDIEKRDPFGVWKA
jgi:hypothetical protein